MVIATVFLCIIGMSAGFALGTRHKNNLETLSQDVPDVNPPSFAPAPGIECPPEMHDTAGRLGFTGPLTQVLRVRADATGTTVWICQDPDGNLYYQGNRGGESAEWVEGQTALFLDGVVREGDTYVAVAHDGNKFMVNDRKLTVVTNSGEKRYDVQPE